MSSGDQLKARILDAARREPSPARDDTERRTRRSVQAAMIVSLLVFLALGGMHAQRRPPEVVLRSVLGWGSVAVVTTWLAVKRGYSMLGRSRVSLLFVAASTPPLLAAIWFVWASALAGEPSLSQSFARDATCLGASIALGLAPLVAFMVMRREGDPVSPMAAGAALGAAAGAWGAFLINLHCETTDSRHVLVGHVLPVALLVAAGAVAGRRFLSVRLRPG